MIHAKIMTIDGIWSVAGSTNFDHRSFALNDEVNVAAMDPKLAEQLDRDFTNDMARSNRRTLSNAANRSVSVRLLDKLERLVKRET